MSIGESAQQLVLNGPLLVAAPICLFLFSAKLWPDPPGLDIFHSGEQLVGSRLVTDGENARS